MFLETNNITYIEERFPAAVIVAKNGDFLELDSTGKRECVKEFEEYTGQKLHDDDLYFRPRSNITKAQALSSYDPVALDIEVGDGAHRSNFFRMGIDAYDMERVVHEVAGNEPCSVVIWRMSTAQPVRRKK